MLNTECIVVFFIGSLWTLAVSDRISINTYKELHVVTACRCVGLFESADRTGCLLYRCRNTFARAFKFLPIMLCPCVWVWFRTRLANWGVTRQYHLNLHWKAAASWQQRMQITATSEEHRFLENCRLTFPGSRVSLQVNHACWETKTQDKREREHFFLTASFLHLSKIINEYTFDLELCYHFYFVFERSRFRIWPFAGFFSLYFLVPRQKNADIS
jgi:hypothetical protein